jgi:hypothetical protein
MSRPLAFFALLALAGCGAEPRAEPARAAAAPPAQAAHAWRANPPSARIARAGDTLVVETSAHAVLWEEDAPELAPPYEVRATIRKRSGRLHEGTGLVLGATGLDGPEAGQVYTYFLTRGDGSFLVKRRQGAQTPIVRDWTRHPAIRRDAEGGGRPNELAVRVGAGEAVFLVNGSEVARIPASELALRGRAGIRAAHDVQIEVTGFSAGAVHP